MSATPTHIFTCGSLFEGARAWYYSVAGGTGAVFTLPHKMPNFISLGFCTWNIIANKVPGFRINTSCIKGIKSIYKAKEGSKDFQMQGKIEYQKAEKEASRIEEAPESSLE